MTPPTRPALHPPRLALAIGLPLLLALGQQQLLLRLPPRLEQLQTASASAGPAALQLRFSRPMDGASLARLSRLQPPLSHRWLGSGNRWQLSLAPGQQLNAPLQLDLAGLDSRGLALRRQRWLWDPRPRPLAVVTVAGGEQLQLRQNDGRWQPLGPVWREIVQLQPLGDGSGVALANRNAAGLLELWRIPLQQRDLQPLAAGDGGLTSLGAARSLAQLHRVQASGGQPLLGEGLLFAHLSSNRAGELLIQSGRLEPASSTALLLSPNGQRRQLEAEASGPMQLLPAGGAVVVPDGEGLHLQVLPPQQQRRQTLPGSRDLSSFCPGSGRALLLRHWPDFRRSLELVEPGQPPRQLWLGAAAVLASACSRHGERIWVLLQDGGAQPSLELVALDRRGRMLQRRRLEGWELEPGTGLHWDASTAQLLLALRRRSAGDRPPAPAQAVLIDAASLALQPLQPPVRQVQWLPAG